jgi:homoserine dehydrogenase
VLSDLSALRYDYRYEYKKLYHHKPSELTSDYYLEIYVSFNSIRFIPTQYFAIIKQGHKHKERSYIVGVISFSKLKEDTWWKDPDVSLIVMPNGIIPVFSSAYNAVNQEEKMQLQD